MGSLLSNTLFIENKMEMAVSCTHGEHFFCKNWFSLSKYSLEKIVLKNCNFEQFWYPIKSVLLRREHIVYANAAAF